MAAALKQPVGAVADWARGHRPVPAGIWKELREVVRLHGLKIADLDPEIVRAYDTAVGLASKARDLKHSRPGRSAHCRSSVSIPARSRSCR